MALGGARFVKAYDRTSVLDNRPLKPVANAEVRHPVSSRPSGRGRHAFGAPGAEAAGDEHAVDAVERGEIAGLEILRFDPTESNL